MSKYQAAPFERRRIEPFVILMKDSNLARAEWFRSILRPFVERNAQLYISSERPSLRRRPDIFVLGDPRPVEGETAQTQASAVTL